ITDVARPLDLPPEEVAKRPDVLVIESGEIELPTKVRGLKSIGLPPNTIYACLAETIVLALEGRFEVFTIGRDTEWEKVKEIYQLGLKHGMKLAAISGVKGVYSDADIAKVVALAKKARKTWKGGSAAVPEKPAAKAKAAAPAAGKPAARKPAAKKAVPAKGPAQTVAAPKPAAPRATAPKAAAKKLGATQAAAAKPAPPKAAPQSAAKAPAAKPPAAAGTGSGATAGKSTATSGAKAAKPAAATAKASAKATPAKRASRKPAAPAAGT
ncbi:MAG: hypothetical protein JNM82_02785, partial [Rhodocyclaceae bacterium]|nr:hypothetical protein [Rhodocyclaceae bacterium]